MTRNRRRFNVPMYGECLEVDYKLLRKLKESLTFAEVQILLDSCETITEKALIETAISTGIRRKDIVNIEVNRVDLENRKITFWEEKKDRLWMVAIPPELVQTLKMYLWAKPVDQRYLFEFSGKTAYNILQKVMKRSGIRKHVPFHGLRRTFIRLSKRMGRDTRFVMDQTGDTARVILEAYEGYTVDEMAEMMKEDNILRRAKKTRDQGSLSVSDLWSESEIMIRDGKMKKLDDFDKNDDK